MKKVKIRRGDSFELDGYVHIVDDVVADRFGQMVYFEDENGDYVYVMAAEIEHLLF